MLPIYELKYSEIITLNHKSLLFLLSCIGLKEKLEHIRHLMFPLHCHHESISLHCYFTCLQLSDRRIHVNFSSFTF